MKRQQPPVSRIKDVHPHFVPTEYREALVAAGNAFPDGSPIPEWSAQGHIELLDELGVTTAMLSASSPGAEVDRRPAYWARFLNEAGAPTRAEHPGRFGWLASLPLTDVDAALGELEYSAELLRADGFALLTNQRGIPG